MMLCPLKFARYEFEGGTDCIGAECGFFGGVCGSVDAHSKAQSKDAPTLSDLYGILSDESDSREKLRIVMPRHNGEKYAKLMVKQFDQLINDELHDSREKIEADVYNHIAISITPNKEDDGVLAPYATVLEWLDRQAAITERECLVQSVQGADAILTAENAELQAKVDELTEQLEAAHAKNRALKAHISKMQAGRHGWHVKGVELEKENAELQAAYDELAAIAAQLCRACGFSMVDAAGEVIS